MCTTFMALDQIILHKKYYLIKQHRLYNVRLAALNNIFMVLASIKFRQLFAKFQLAKLMNPYKKKFVPFFIYLGQCFKTFYVRNLLIFVRSQSVFRIGWKSLSGTNNLAYYGKSWNTVKKSFITLAPGTRILDLGIMSRAFYHCATGVQPSRGAQKLTGEHPIVVLAKFSTLSQAVLLL